MGGWYRQQGGHLGSSKDLYGQSHIGLNSSSIDPSARPFQGRVLRGFKQRTLGLPADLLVGHGLLHEALQPGNEGLKVLGAQCPPEPNPDDGAGHSRLGRR